MGLRLAQVEHEIQHGLVQGVSAGYAHTMALVPHSMHLMVPPQARLSAVSAVLFGWLAPHGSPAVLHYELQVRAELSGQLLCPKPSFELRSTSKDCLFRTPLVLQQGLSSVG